ncbi:replication protein A 70 kDa DNA-binding subunit B, partial [Tanacetum coccineum]
MFMFVDTEMEQKLTLLCDVDPMMDDVRILASCISIWKSHPKGKPHEVWSLDMVLQDPHVELINKFHLLIDEGSRYRIGDFGVGDNGGKYPLLNHKFKIAFYKNTSLTRLASFDKNSRGFRFEPFQNFTTKHFKETELVDVVGTIVSISEPIPFNNFGEHKIRRTVILEDVDTSTDNASSSSTKQIDCQLTIDLKNMLGLDNPLVKQYRLAGHRLSNGESYVKLRLI